MNRFFSKLDLRDIKIDPEGSRFPPDADDEQDDAAAATDSKRDAFHQTPVINDADEDEDPAAPATSFSADAASYAPYEAETPSSNGQHDHETLQNGHIIEEVSETVVVETTTTYVVDGEIVGVAGEVLKVSARSRPSAVAGAIAGVVREAGKAEVQAIGAGATNQAVKAVAIARDYLMETGIDAICVPAFIDVTIDNEDRTAIRLVVEAR